MKSSVKKRIIAVAISSLFAPVLFIVGFLNPTWTILDTSFGLFYYFLDTFGLWKSSPNWILENKVMSLCGFLIFPLIVSFFYTLFMVITIEKIWKKDFRLGIVYIILLLLFFGGLQSSPKERVSFWVYHFSNF